MLNVVVLNGGRGAAALIPSLLDKPGLMVTSVVNAYDDGKSTGEIRRFFNMLGPSDIRKVQELMLPDDGYRDDNLALFRFRYDLSADHDKVVRQLLDFASGGSDLVGPVRIRQASVLPELRRYVRAFVETLLLIEKVHAQRFDFSDCSVMNAIFAGAFVAHDRNIERATLAIGRLFRLRGAVLPTSIESKHLVGLRENGEMLYCEAEIVELRSNVRIERVFLLDSPVDKAAFENLSHHEKRCYLNLHHCFVGASPRVELALRQADIIIYSAGTQHSSLYPTYLTTGLSDTIANNVTALKFFVVNIGADYETPSYKASDYVQGALSYLNLAAVREHAPSDLLDFILLNSSRIKSEETYVELDLDQIRGIGIPCVIDDFECRAQPGKHNGVKMVDVILDLYERGAAAHANGSIAA